MEKEVEDLIAKASEDFNRISQLIRDKALRDAAALIRAEWVCCDEEKEPELFARHECCRFSEYAARNVERLIGTPHNFGGSIYEWEAENGK